MTLEEILLDNRFWHSLSIFDVVITDYKERDTKNQDDEFIKMLESAREDFCNVHEQWQKKCDASPILNASLLAKFLRDVADDIEREANPHLIQSHWRLNNEF